MKRKPMDRWFLFLRRLQSGQLLLLSYLWTIGAGTLLLWLPWSSSGEQLHLVDALFTSASAVCVTGLTVVDTGSAFSTFGKTVLLALIQIGGLGIMTFSVMMFLSIGRIPALQERWVIEKSFASSPMVQIWDLVKTIFLFTFFFEALGAALLFIGWLRAGFSVGKSLWYAVFHSVSAFCNAGFSFFPGSFTSFRGDWLINLTVCGLIVLGGLGFFVLYELSAKFGAGKRLSLSLHSRLVLWTTLLLVASGAAGFFLMESGNLLKGLPFAERLLASLFQSVTARTAGFNTVDIGALGNSTLLMVILLMFVGASPGSCGGGVRTTSLALLAALFVNRLKGSRKVNICGRTIPEDTVHKMVSLIMLGVLAVLAITMLLLLTQPQEIMHPRSRVLFLDYLFESVSALGTVGLSMGITGGLNTLGKLFIVILMYVGRVGLATLAYGLIRQQDKYRIEYASEDVML